MKTFKMFLIAGVMGLCALPAMAGHHHGHHHNNGVRLAADIVNLVGNVLRLPAAVIAPAPVVVTQPTVVAPAAVAAPAPVLVVPPPVYHYRPAPPPRYHRGPAHHRHHRGRR